MPLSDLTRKIHFIGIGGIGMSGIAELLLNLRHKVSGSDLAESETVLRLRELGAQISVGHSEENISKYQPDVVVYSTAVNAQNPELNFAKQNGTPIIRRAEMLAELMRLKRGVALAGSHGKTTTTGLISLLVREGGLDPTIVIGGKFDAIGSNAAWGGGQWLIAEADESDGSFLRLSPEIAVVTNIDREHLDHYGSFDKALQAFEEFIDQLPFYGKAILCSDCENLRSLQKSIRKPRVWYGFEKKHEPDFWIDILTEGKGSSFNLYQKKDAYHEVFMNLEISVPGRHNVLNSVAAVLAALEMGVSHKHIQSALKKFTGVRRRFELKGAWRGHPIYEDYAHHPTEIRATLAAAKNFFSGKKPIVLFQPHRYSRTRDQWKDFSMCFEGAHEVYVLPIYAASESRENWADEIDGAAFANNIANCKAHALPNQKALIERILVDEAKWPSGSPVFFLGAGDISKSIPSLLQQK